MGCSGEDCKELLCKGQGIVDRGSDDFGGWCRRAKKKGDLGVERVFEHESGLCDLVGEGASGIWVAGYGRDESCANRKPASKAGPANAGAPRHPEFPSLWTVSHNKKGLAQARKSIKGLLSSVQESDHFRYGGEDGVAMANQFVFGFAEQNIELHIMIITPIAYWESDGCICDQECFIKGLLPEDSEELNGRGTWGIPWKGSQLGLGQELLLRGFAWDGKYQIFLDANFGFDGVAIMEPLLRAASERNDIAASAAASQAKGPAAGGKPRI